MNPTHRHFKLLWQVSQHHSPQPERNPSQIWRADGLEGALHFRTVQAEVSLYSGGCANSVFAMKLSVLEPGLQANEAKRIKAGTLQQEPTYRATCQHQMIAMNGCVQKVQGSASSKQMFVAMHCVGAFLKCGSRKVQGSPAGYLT